MVQLSTNMKELITFDYNQNTKIKRNIKSYSIDNITHIIQGNPCPHVKNHL